MEQSGEAMGAEERGAGGEASGVAAASGEWGRRRAAGAGRAQMSRSLFFC